ncbi:hypothetical protein CUC08_Gglean004361 [Alternaria sp. MG1]|uniref:WD40 repeat-like protein n=1 Tax=Alternaria tenuissima TaxID=119927 RepID=A0AB37W7Z2_9PLEO|nr:hypothetical protein CUC08_Gglean004361 [Alternaria sp. MG1]RYN22678.1 hypothetical protein AA0115_g9078 [Alternaria tenuissima]
MPCYSRKDFMREFVFPDEPAQDFERAGIAAQYASGHPKDWSQTDDILDFSADLREDPENIYRSYYTDLSSDKKLLAISTDAERILIYDLASRELCEVLEGSGYVTFRPSDTNEESVADVDQGMGVGTPRPGYTLVSSISHEAHRRAPGTNQLILWDLDQNGRILDKEEPIDPAVLATKAIDAIAPDLAASHEWTREFIDASTLRSDFMKSLNQAAADHRRRHNTIIDNATLGNFGSVSFSADGKLLLYHSKNDSTQQGMREPDDLPVVAIYDLEAGIETHRLTGHTDAIMWSAISPDKEHVASVSWDGTMRMYSASTGALMWVTENSGGQSWAGAFSPDSKLIVWSSKNGHAVQVHVVSDGQKTAAMQEKFSHWCRSLKWHPTEPKIALCVDEDAYIWDPSDGPNGKVLQHFKVESDKGLTRIWGIQDVWWMDEGRLLGLETSDGSVLVYNTHNNAKELFRRPAGTMACYVQGGLYGIIKDQQEHDVYAIVCGDEKVRFFRTSVPAFPSWWEKEPPSAVVEKKSFPETGKYVKITKNSKKAPS